MFVEEALLSWLYPKIINSFSLDDFSHLGAKNIIGTVVDSIIVNLFPTISGLQISQEIIIIRQHCPHISHFFAFLVYSGMMSSGPFALVYLLVAIDDT